MLRASILVFQAASGLLLILVGLPVSALHQDNGSLNRRGWTCLLVGAGCLVVGLIMSELAAARSEDILFEKIDDLREIVFRERAPRVMLTPPRGSRLPPQPSSDALRIESPRPNSRVQPRESVTGTLAEDADELWVIVHPVETGAFWVQPRAVLHRSGKWSASAFFGRGGAIDAGKRFDIMAVADPEVPLEEAQVIGEWPRSQWRSEVVTVERE